jgi:hypothetical protein
VLVGSCLIETGRILAERLRERGVRAVHIVEERDGRAQTKNPRKRGGRGVRVRGGRRRRALRPTRTLGARDASSAR